MGVDPDVSARRTNRVEAAARLGGSMHLGSDYDVVLDAAGTQDSMDTATHAVRPGGTIGVLSTFWSPVSVGLGLLMKEVTVVPAFAYGHHDGSLEFDVAADLLARTTDLAPTLITHRFELGDAAEAFRVAADRDAAAIKVVLLP